MEVYELKEVIEDNFEALDKRLAICFKSIEDKNVITDKAIAVIDVKVSSHEHWLWFLRGAVALLIIIGSWIGFKVRF